MKWIKRQSPKEKLLKAYDREMLRSAFASLFWVIISYRKSRDGFTLKALADKVGVNKSEPSKWFRGSRPNWTLNTVADIASALGVDVEVRARDRETGAVFTPSGLAETKMRPLGSVEPTATTEGPVAPIDLRKRRPIVTAIGA
jgi:transcriptional regulator with XRE-family HTH domain